MLIEIRELEGFDHFNNKKFTFDSKSSQSRLQKGYRSETHW